MNAIDIAQRNGANNRAAVWNFFQDNPCHTKAECALALGLSAKTVGGHCAAIKLGWRPDVVTPHLDALRSIVRSVSYPVCTSINSRGFDLHCCSDDLIELVYEIANTSICDENG